ncbi:hypothetical protein Dda_8261 [Drechslerella dactyloides]|uniref:Uncharacterized protein n=1 Tax=Drechslerella dactyloides TaxID=74499 RepID=A0AAD6IS23_DREDA|nr:hypothetical protein Dda_8261 [Drechslerella dactyloides]
MDMDEINAKLLQGMLNYGDPDLIRAASAALAQTSPEQAPSAPPNGEPETVDHPAFEGYPAQLQVGPDIMVVDSEEPKHEIWPPIVHNIELANRVLRTDGPPFTETVDPNILKNLNEEDKAFVNLMHGNLTQTRGDILEYREQMCMIHQFSLHLRPAIWGNSDPTPRIGPRVTSIAVKILKHAQSAPFQKTVDNLAAGKYYSYTLQRETVRIFLESAYRYLGLFNYCWNGLLQCAKAIELARGYKKRIDETFKQMDLDLTNRDRDAPFPSYFKVMYYGECKELHKINNDDNDDKLERYARMFECFYKTAIEEWAEHICKTINQLNFVLKAFLASEENPNGIPAIQGEDINALSEMKMVHTQRTFDLLGKALRVIYVRAPPDTPKKKQTVSPNLATQSSNSGSSGAKRSSGSKMRDLEVEVDELLAYQEAVGSIILKAGLEKFALNFEREPGADEI